MTRSMHCTFNSHSVLTTIAPIVCLLPIYFIELGNPSYTSVARMTASLILFSLNIGVFFHPWKITYKNQIVYVKTLFKTHKIKLRWCCFDSYNPERLGDCKRIIGTHGAWGYYGIYEDFKLGKIRVCATHADNLIVVHRDGELPLVVNDFMPLFDYQIS